MTVSDRVERITCLGCGCGCDDIAVTIRADRIVEASPACPLEKSWLGDGVVPWEVLRSGDKVGINEALTEAAELLADSAGRLLVYIGTDLTTQAQRAAVMLADLLRAKVDSATSESAATGLLVAQRRGRATATLGEIRNRADVVLFWGVDPRQRYPRFLTRYAPEPIGTQVSGRSGRYVISVAIGKDEGPPDADVTLALEPSEEIDALTLMRAAVAGREPGEIGGKLREALALVPRLTGARYVALVHDAEATAEPRNPLRVEALIALAQALNGPSRATLTSLRAGGNRVGVESVLTWQTGYPFAVDYSRGHPRYVPAERGVDSLLSGCFSAALVVGSPPLDQKVGSALGQLNTVAIGPRVSEAGFKARVAIDTGIAGIHEGGTGYRMDEVPLPLYAPLRSQRSTAETLLALAAAIKTLPRKP